MKKTDKIWLGIASGLILAGALLFVGALSSMNFDFTKLSTQKYETNIYEIDDEFEGISIDTSMAGVQFELSDDKQCKVECVENDKLKHSVKVEEGTLKIEEIDTRKWYDHIGISFGNDDITVYLPKEEYNALHIETDIGNVKLPAQFKFRDIKITGKTSNVNCETQVSETVEIRLTTGNTVLNGVNCKTIYVGSSTGNVKFEGCDADAITVKTSTGNVKGTLLSEKVFMTETSTGNVRVPKTSAGGNCKITTSTGNIEIEISK